ncbi:MAG: aldo/keto reductase [Pirellulales bacterium]
MLDYSIGNAKPFAVPLAFGLLRLCGEERPDQAQAIEVIHAALDAGIRFLDTADSYCLNEKEKHYGERLAWLAVDRWHGPRKEVVIATKVGMLRPKGKWTVEGSPKHLRKAIEGSLQTLQTDCLPLVQLHARDPRVPFEESLGALAEMQREGKIAHLGLCNVDPYEMRQARRAFEVASIQNEFSLMQRGSATDGSLSLAEQWKLPFLAYRPLGGSSKVEKLATNRMLAPLLKKYPVAPAALAFAVWNQLGLPIIPLFGARSVAHLHELLQGRSLVLDPSDLEQIRGKLGMDLSEPAKLAVRVPSPSHVVTSIPGEEDPSRPEVVVVMGIQGAGKSSLVESYVQRGYFRLNRDLQGGSLEDLIPKMIEAIDEGQQQIVLDNTYPTQTSRMPVIDAAHYFGLPIRCQWIQTSLQDAQFNVAHRMWKRYQKLLGPEEMKSLAKVDPNLPPAIALDRWVESFETPRIEEGFFRVDIHPFERKWEPSWQKRGILLDVDGTLRKTKSGELYPRTPDDVELLPGRREVLEEWIEQGFKLYFVSNQSGIASGKVTRENAEAAFARTVELLDLPVEDIAFCPHPAFPVGCFCRKPLPGLGVDLICRHQLHPPSLVVVGDMESDRQFAQSLSAKYFDAKDFFAP